MKDENTFAPLPEHARKMLDAAQAKIEALQNEKARMWEEERGAYKDGYAYGVKHGFEPLVEAKALGVHPDDQTLRIEWDRGYAHCRANAMLGHDVKLLLEHEMFWIEDESALVIELKAKLDKAERLCLDCKHCYLYNAQPNYSELTPGSGLEFRCEKGKWKYDTYNHDKKDMKTRIEMARECADFEEL
jgi:hypothetical protein